MEKPDDIREQLADLQVKMAQAIDDAETFDRLEAEHKALEAKRERAERLQAVQAASAKPVKRAEPGDDTGGDRGPLFGRLVQCICGGKGSRDLAIAEAERRGDAQVIRALEASSGPAGGFMVPTQHSRAVIDELRARMVFYAAGPEIYPLAGRAEIPVVTSGAAGAYMAEGGDIGDENPTFGQIVLTSKRLASIVPISNDLLRNADPSAAGVVQRVVTEGMSRTAQTALLRGDGTGAGPKGLRYWAASANIFSSAGSTATQIEDDLRSLLGKLEDNDTPMVRPALFMAPRSYRELYNLRDANGNLVFPEVRISSAERPFGTVYNAPIYATTAMPTNLGGGSDAEIVAADMSEVILGEETSVEVMVSDTAAYASGGSVISAFSRDQSVLRAITRHDMAVKHATSVAVMTGVSW